MLKILRTSPSINVRRWWQSMLALGMFIVAVPAGAAAAPSDWVLSYAGKSTNTFISDARTRGLIKNGVPATVTGDLLAALGGPPDPVYVVDRRYFSGSACVPHACDAKGLYWLDTRSGAALGALLTGDTLVLGSNRLLPATLPMPARQVITAWLSENNAWVSTVQFVSAGARPTPLSPSQFNPALRYEASVDGPSFDCSKARTAVETAICGDANVAKLDLELAQLLTRIRQGSGTSGAREQLLAMQRAWLKGRDAACGNAAHTVECLDAQYRQQHDRLMNWVPTH